MKEKKMKCPKDKEMVEDLLSLSFILLFISLIIVTMYLSFQLQQ
jgi:hypothetical protein